MSPANNIIDVFDAIYCINLDKRPDRWKEALEEFESRGIKGVERVSAIDGKNLDITKYNYSKKVTPSELGLILTNINIIKQAKHDGLQRILITEDDVVFTDQIANFQSLYRQVPDDWDMLYFGGNHNKHKGWKPPVEISTGVVKLHLTYTTHCIGIHEKMFDTILGSLNDAQTALDVTYTKLQQTNNVYCFYPGLATQRVSYSDIREEMRDYSDWIE